MTVNCNGPEQSLLSRQNTNLPCPRLLVKTPVFAEGFLRSYLLAIAISLKGANRMSNCPAGAPAFWLLVSQGLRIRLSTSVRAATLSPLITCVVSQLLNHFFI